MTATKELPMTLLADSLRAQRENCAAGEYVCRRKCRRCARYIAWCVAQKKQPNL